jgi:DNA-binding XRE family transcriptional regulator
MVVPMAKEFDRYKWIEARKDANLRQEDIARMAKRNRVTICNIERGDLKPSYELVAILAGIVKMQPDELYKEANVSFADLPLPDDEKRLIASYRNMSPLTRNAILTLINNLSADDFLSGSEQISRGLKRSQR